MNDSIINWDKFLLPYNQAVCELTTKLKSLADGFHYLSETPPIELVEGRTKSITSILDKAKRKGVSVYEIEKEIEDIAGIRIICRFVDDIKRVVWLIKERHGLDLEVKKERDYVKSMKPSGYRSYHMIIEYPVITALGKKAVLCEIQIRTLAMNFWAVIEHSLKYKYKGEIPGDIQMRLIRSAEAAFRLDNEISEIRCDILEAECSTILKDNTVDSILKKIQSLYKVANLEDVDALNKRFFSIYENGTNEQLVELDRQIQAIANLYRLG